MGFSYNKAIELRPQKERALSTFFIAFFLSALVVVPYMFMNGEFFKNAAEQGFGQLGTFLLTPKDMSKYYFPFGAVGFIVGAPVGLLANVIPEFVLQYLGAFSIVLRVSLAALFGYCYIRRFTRTPEAARLGGFLYAFSGAVIGITVNNALHNLVVLFPLVLLAAETLMTESRRVLLALAVMGAVLLSPYAAMPMLTFLLVYVILRMTSRDVNVDFSRVFGVFFEILAGAFSVAILLVPAAVVNAMNTFDYRNFFDITALFNTGEAYLSVLKSFFLPPESVNSALSLGVASNSGLFGAYLPLLSMSGVIACCGAKKGSGFKRIIILSIVCLCIPALNYVFSLGNAVTGYAWLYMPTLVFALTSVMAFENRELPLGSGLKWSAAMTVIASAVFMAFPRITESGITLGFLENGTQGLARFGIYAGIVLIGIIATAIVLKASECRDKSMFNALFVCTVLLSVAVFWLCLATEIYYFKSTLLSTNGGTLSAVLSLTGIDVARVLQISMISSVGVLGALVIYIIICISTHKKRSAAEFAYPEGEDLLELWQQYDEEDSDDYEPEKDDDFSLESIAESLQIEYPVDVKPDEFKGGFNIVADIPTGEPNKPVDKA